MLEKLEVTLPFSEMILNMPTYTKFLKDILTKKRTLGDQQMLAMEKECSALLLNKMPHKLGDPGSFSIPCVVGGVPISKDLCDLGASVSVLPLKVSKKIGPKLNQACTLEVIDEVVEEVAREESEMEEAFQIAIHE
ncbi:uncharacterized protein LOC141629145 [Silene latifolia]|uniref:uncharacterized protein LOC141629145 n=1 Tax=Silene latifolia TaxID=37657 RepID=UPI003D776409